jgi:hypothetical protein
MFLVYDEPLSTGKSFPTFRRFLLSQSSGSILEVAN